MWGLNPQPRYQESQAPQMEPAMHPEIWLFLWVESEERLKAQQRLPSSELCSEKINMVVHEDRQ